MKAARLIAVLSLCASAAPALACGHCVEDRIAAVYDHVLIQHAAAQKLEVAYFAWDGPAIRNEFMRAKIAAAAQGVPGVGKAMVRVSMEPAAIAVVYDATRFSRAQLDASLQKQLAPLKLSAIPLQSVSRPGGA